MTLCTPIYIELPPPFFFALLEFHQLFGYFFSFYLTQPVFQEFTILRLRNKIQSILQYLQDLNLSYSIWKMFFPIFTKSQVVSLIPLAHSIT